MNIVQTLAVLREGGPVSLGVAVILITMSIASWTVILIRTLQACRQNLSGAAFLSHFWESAPDRLYSSAGSIPEPKILEPVLAKLLQSRPKAAANPFARICADGVQALEHFAHCARQGFGSNRRYDEFIAAQLQHALDRENTRMEKGLTLLASIGSIAPFVGLFGTVWGIYHALGTIAAEGQATVDKVAGPVGEALIMTAVGLAVAMPAVLAYNALIRHNRLAAAKMQNFAHELHVYVTTGCRLGSGPAQSAKMPSGRRSAENAPPAAAPSEVDWAEAEL